MAQYELNLRDYARIFYKRKFVILACFLVSLVWSSVYLSTQPEIYKSSTTVKIVERKNIAGLLTEWIVYDPADMMSSQAKIITGFPTVKGVAERIGLINESIPVSEADRIVVGLQGKITAERVGATNLIKISAFSDSARGAMELANTVALVYVEQNLMEKRKQSSTARVFIEEQLNNLEKRLANGEEQVRQFGEDVPDIKLLDPFQEKLLAWEFEMSTLLQKYTDHHPRVVQLKEQIGDLQKQVKEVSGQDLEYAGLLREVEVNKKLYSLLKERLEEARIAEAQKVEDVSVVDPAVLPLSPVSSQKGGRILVSGLGGLILGIALAFIMETLDTSMGTIEDVEELLGLPILGVIPSATRQIAEKKGVFGAVSYLLNRKKADSRLDECYIRLISHYEPTSPLAESYRHVRTSIRLTENQKCILVTSAGPGEGKSTIIANLGLIYAQKGLQTLLISTDLRRPVMAKTFGVKKDPGINELLSGTATLEDCLRGVTDMMMGEIPLQDIIKSPGLGNLTLLPCGHMTVNPAEMLESREFAALLSEFKTQYDVILFDSPPVLSISDTSFLVPKVDMVVMCYEIGKTSRHALLRAKNQLDLLGANISGVILNHIAGETQSLESYPYYGSYGSEEEEAEVSQVA